MNTSGKKMGQGQSLEQAGITEPNEAYTGSAYAADSSLPDNLFNEIPGGVGIFALGDKLECKYFSDGFAQLSGRTRAEVEALFQNGTFLETLIAPEDFDETLIALRRCIMQGKPINLTFRYVLKNGATQWIHLSAEKMREESITPSYFCIVGTPSEETELFRGVVEESSVGVFVVERGNHRVLYMNSAIAEMFGSTREQLKKHWRPSAMSRKTIDF